MSQLKTGSGLAFLAGPRGSCRAGQAPSFLPIASGLLWQTVHKSVCKGFKSMRVGWPFVGMQFLKFPSEASSTPPLISFLQVECSETGNASLRSLQFLVSGPVSVPFPPGDILLSHKGTAGSEISIAPNVEMKWAGEGILGLLFKVQNAHHGSALHSSPGS